jgi:hypothetical protein
MAAQDEFVLENGGQDAMRVGGFWARFVPCSFASFLLLRHPRTRRWLVSSALAMQLTNFS